MPRVSHQAIDMMLEIARFCLAAMTILSLLTIYYWTYYPAHVTSIDTSYSKAYFDSMYAMRTNGYHAYTEQNYSDAVIIAADSLERMKYVRKTDHVYPVKRELLLILIQSKVNLGEADGALPYARSWYQSDERDAEALVTYIQVLKELPEHNTEKLAAIDLFKTRFPGQTKWPATFF